MSAKNGKSCITVDVKLTGSGLKAMGEVNDKTKLSITFSWRSFAFKFHNLWKKYKQIQISWLWFFVVIEK